MTDWILISEKLPEHAVDVLCCNTKRNIYVAQIYLYHEGSIDWLSGDATYGDCWVDYPIAWQPLPEPYRG